MDPERFPRLVSLACHDLRTPLATVYGFARTLTRGDGLDERTARFLEMIEEASEQMTGMLDDLGTAARIAGKRWEPALLRGRHARARPVGRHAHRDERRRRDGRDRAGARVARLKALAIAAIRYGPVKQVDVAGDRS